MYTKLVAVAVAAAIGLALIVSRGTLPARAQVPCVPTAPFSTVCAPIQTVRLLCPNPNLPAYLPSYYGGWYGGSYGYNWPFVGYYGATAYPAFSAYSYGYVTPVLVTFDQAGNVTQVTQAPDLARSCESAVARPAPTLVPTQAPTIVYVPQPVAETSSVRLTQPLPLADKAGIRPPSTGDAGLLTKRLFMWRIDLSPSAPTNGGSANGGGSSGQCTGANAERPPSCHNGNGSGN